MIGKEAASRASFLESLSRCQRLVLMMHFGDQLSPADIAAILELSEVRVTEIILDLREQAGRTLGMTLPGTQFAEESGSPMHSDSGTLSV